MRGQKEGAAETLDLQRPLRLRLHAAPESVPTGDRERTDDREHDAGEREQRRCETTPPDGDAEEREKGSRIDLGRDRETKQGERKRRSVVEQST